MNRNQIFPEKPSDRYSKVSVSEDDYNIKYADKEELFFSESSDNEDLFNEEPLNYDGNEKIYQDL